mgnify:CR=1 FL=1
MKKIGLTGIIGSGKTTAALYFKGLGVPVFIADDCAKKLWEYLVKHFLFQLLK